MYNKVSNNHLCLHLIQRFRVFMRKTHFYITLYIRSIENIVFCRQNKV